MMSIKQLTGHFNWINLVGLSAYLISTAAFVMFDKYDVRALIISFGVKGIFQNVLMLYIINGKIRNIN